MRRNSSITAFALTAMVLLAGCARTGAFTGRAPWLGKAPTAAKSGDSETAKNATAKKRAEPEPSSTVKSEPAPPAAEQVAKESAEKTTKESPPDSESAAKEKESESAAKKKEEVATAANVEEKTESSAQTVDATDKAPASDEASPKTLDAATLMMMDDYLKDVPFEERQQLYREWKSLDAATIRERIRQREVDATDTSPQESDFNPFLEPVADSNTPAEAESGNAGIEPAGFEVAEVSEGEQNRPVPLMDSLIAEGTEAPPKEYDPAPDPDAGWAEQLEKLIPVAQARAEATQALYLESQSTTPTTEEESQAHAALQRDYIASQVDLRLLYLMAGQRGRALQVIPDLEPAEQEFWRQILWSIASYFDAESLPNRSERITQTIEQLRTAVNKLQGEAKLELRNVAFCRKITSFGNFERFEEQTYSPGQKVLLYAEIVNYKSIPRATDGLFETQLKSTIEILKKGEGEPLQRIKFEPTVDLCRSHRQDYFHSYELKLPADLAPGPHVLKLTVEDIQGGDVAIYTLNFTIK